MITRKHNSNFLILTLLFFFFLLPLFFITKRSLHPTFSSYLNFFPTTQSQFNTLSDKGGTFVDKGNTIVDNGGLSDNSNVTSSINYPNLDHKTNKGGTFVDKGGTFVDNGGVFDNSNVSSATNDLKLDHETNKGGTFVDKGVTFVDEGGLSDNSSTEIKHGVPNETIHTNPDPETNKGDTFVDNNGDGIEDSKGPEEVLFSLPGSKDGEVDDEKEKKEADLLRRCNLYEGKWVKDEEGKNYPIYKPGACPYVDEAYDCQRNGRLDSEYLKWWWKPNECELPRFSSASFLERLRGKKLMLIGDSMNRNQFESLLCMLWEGLSNKSKMYEIHGYKITKGRGYYSFKFEDYDCSVEFVRSHFLVKEGIRLNGQGKSNPTLSIDIIDKSAGKWRQADILVFNTGHWWTHGKTARGKDYYKEGDHIYPRFDAVEAYRRAMKTWAKWIDANISSKKLVIYRGYSSAHFRGGDWDSGGSCNGEKEPVTSGAILDSYPQKMKVVDEVIKDMKSPVVLLNVTRLTNFRKDGHPSVYGKTSSVGKKVSTRRQDCSHWCLPGVPDSWNELVLATMMLHQTSSAA